jgi:predicted PurR-regulated permease PerM
MASNTPINNNSKPWFYLIITLFVVFFIHFLGSVLVPFLIAALLAYITNPFVNLLQKIHLPRIYGVIVVFLLLIVLFTVSILIIIPIFERQLLLFINKLPLLIEWIQGTLIPWLDQRLALPSSLHLKDLASHLTGHWQQAGKFASSLFGMIFSSTFTVIAWIMNLFLIPVVLFYLLRDWPKVLSGIHTLLPRPIEPLVFRLVGECNEVLGAFLRGQLMVMFTLAILYSVGLSIIGVDTALVIGIVSGSISIVPYLGFIVGISTASIAAFFQYHDFIHIIGVFLVFIIVQTLEGSVLTPCLVGDKVGLHPVIVIFSLLAGGKLFGFVGILLAIPVAAVLMVLLRALKEKYLMSELYHS